VEGSDCFIPTCIFSIYTGQESLLAAEKVAEKYLSRGGRQYKTVHQVKEMVAVLKKRSTADKARSLQQKSL
jgi:predicted transcriptional regulator with HTH domain